MKSNALCLVLMVAFLSNIDLIRAQSPTVCLAGSETCLLGTFMPGYQGDQFEAFLGIPFAKPPIDKLRFSNPKQSKLWKGTLLAQEPKPDCVQKQYLVSTAPITGAEDCLYLNVYRPQSRTSKKLAVIFYIHGGGFFMGSPSPLVEGPEYFMDTNEVIFVVPAYRLGPFGFLSTNDTKMTGNFALKDQNLALKWVNKHISAFGGDPNSVTIAGHSAGAASVHFHMLSPASKGLFHKAILMSGAANDLYATPIDDPKAQVIKVAEAAGIKNAAKLTSSKLVKALRKLDAVELLIAADTLKSALTYPLVNFRPNIEEPTWSKPFLTKEVFSSLTGNSNCVGMSVPWIIGDVPSKGEGLVIALRLSGSQTARDILNADFNATMIDLLELHNPVTAGAELESLISEYMDGVYELNDDTLDGFLELLGDVNFLYPAYNTIRYHLSPNDTNDSSCADSSTRSTQNSENNSSLEGIIYFDYRGPYSFSTIFSGSSKNFSTAHIDDLLYLFRAPLYFPQTYPVSSPEEALARRYVGLYVDFATTGKVHHFEQMEPCTKALHANGSCQYLSIVKSAEQMQIGTSSIWNIKRMELLGGVYKK